MTVKSLILRTREDALKGMDEREEREHDPRASVGDLATFRWILTTPGIPPAALALPANVQSSDRAHLHAVVRGHAARLAPSQPRKGPPKVAVVVFVIVFVVAILIFSGALDFLTTPSAPSSNQPNAQVMGGTYTAPAGTSTLYTVTANLASCPHIGSTFYLDLVSVTAV